MVDSDLGGVRSLLREDDEAGDRVGEHRLVLGRLLGRPHLAARFRHQALRPLSLLSS